MKKIDIIHDKIYFNKKEAAKRLKYWKFKDEKVVFTNGCFDLVHRGHIEYLAKAADIGTKLIVGLNSDASVKNLKGESRPINDEDSRAELLAAFSFIDMVIIFDEETPLELIQYISPKYLVKGSDYKVEEIVGYDHVKRNGGDIITMNFLSGYSSTNIIKKIKAYD
ncbi:MAG: D-glycero-beta-D-manno-heptose 1-phosphate adenylyltransferase [Marinifilaceae bacterium]|jgi:rfaE bifunctional protein nucleotidyltransferase chain/domain|nr:D-glycero-beta-D-manno-heptose 1-phosphate adenylyltransferase [Marinifilaceae bacterium]